MQAIGKALWFIEANVGDPVSLDDVARASGMSRFHLARTFAALVGLPVVAYARGRRLTEAARRLADGAPDILAVALDAGYGSHEAFTRAFRDQFGLTPEEARTRRSLANLAIVEAIRMPDQTTSMRAPDRFVKSSSMLFAGLRKYFRYEDRGGIPMLWHAFGAYQESIPSVIAGAAYGLCLFPADAADDCGFDYAPAVQVKSLDDLPEGLSGIRVEAREWAVYLHREHVSTVGATCAAAGEWLAQSGRTPTTGKMQMIERYGPEFDPRTGMGGCEVWIPVAGKP
ncbi:MAG TPA: helix-turn-helix domain-containing protein [Hyphomonadaceae bacterium]|nr:helix-turn-helix domain-containing protein [Hyphomonadaceae bacterium]